LLKIGAQGDCSYHRSILAIRRLRAVACAAAGWNQRHGGASSKNAKQQHGGGGKFTSTWICCSGDFFGNPFPMVHHHFKTTIWDHMSLFKLFPSIFHKQIQVQDAFFLVENKEAFMFNKAHHGGIHFLSHLENVNPKSSTVDPSHWLIAIQDTDFWCRKRF